MGALAGRDQGASPIVTAPVPHVMYGSVPGTGEHVARGARRDTLNNGASWRWARFVGEYAATNVFDPPGLPPAELGSDSPMQPGGQLQVRAMGPAARATRDGPDTALPHVRRPSYSTACRR